MTQLRRIDSSRTGRPLRRRQRPANLSRRALLTAVTALALASAASASHAGGTVSATAPVSVTVLAPVTIAVTQGLDFGAVTRPSGAGANTVSLDVNSSQVTLSGPGDAARAAGTTGVAKFNVIGPSGITYSTTQSLSFAQPGLGRVAVSAPVAANGVLGLIPASGVQELRFGGAFDVTSATPAQAYSGSLSLTVNYN